MEALEYGIPDLERVSEFWIAAAKGTPFIRFEGYASGYLGLYTTFMADCWDFDGMHLVFGRKGSHLQTIGTEFLEGTKGFRVIVPSFIESNYFVFGASF